MSGPPAPEGNERDAGDCSQRWRRCIEVLRHALADREAFVCHTRRAMSRRFKTLHGALQTLTSHLGWSDKKERGP
jgi:hypothetical protein